MFEPFVRFVCPVPSRSRSRGRRFSRKPPWIRPATKRGLPPRSLTNVSSARGKSHPVGRSTGRSRPGTGCVRSCPGRWPALEGGPTRAPSRSSPSTDGTSATTALVAAACLHHRASGMRRWLPGPGLPATPRWRRPGPAGSHASYQSLLEGSRWDAGKRRHGSVRTSVVPVQGSLRRARFRVSTRRVASSKRTTNPVLGPKIGIGKRRRRTTGSLATSIPFALATCRARRTAALRDESRSPTHLNSKLSIGPNTIASGARWLTASSVG